MQPGLLVHVLRPLTGATPSPSPSGTPVPSPSPSSTGGAIAAAFDNFQNAFTPSQTALTCNRDDVSVCGLVYKWTGHKTLGQVLEVVLGTPLRLVMIVIIGILIRRLLHRLIDRLAERIATGRPSAGEGLLVARPATAGAAGSGPAAGSTGPSGGNTSPLMTTRREARARTLASVLRSVTTAMVSIIVVMMVLQELDFSVAPLLASAGVAGVALGFGSQSLVRDVVSGMFMIVEDQYGVGDVVDVGEASGTVEAVGLRITRLRDVNGTVWYVRNGEILRVGNQSQGWSRAVLDVNVGYLEDIDRVEAVLLEVAQAMRTEAEYSALILDEPDVWGVEALTAEGVVVRLVVKTRPLQQWTVARELRRRIKMRFDTEGIEMRPIPRTVIVEDGHQDDEPARPRHDEP